MLKTLLFSVALIGTADSPSRRRSPARQARRRQPGARAGLHQRAGDRLDPQLGAALPDPCGMGRTSPDVQAGDRARAARALNQAGAGDPAAGPRPQTEASERPRRRSLVTAWRQQMLLDLAGRGAREFGDEIEAPRHLVGGEARAAEGGELGIVGPGAVRASWTKARPTSPHFGSGSPSTATSTTAGWADSTFSTSAG